MMRVFTAVRATWRLLLLVVLLLGGLLWQAATFAWNGLAFRRASIRLWSGAVLRALGIRLVVREAEPGRLAGLAPGRMIVSNHVSWLDIVAINAIAPAAFVAKSGIRDWPVVGWLVAMAGTVFLRRGTGHGQGVPAVVDALRQRIREGHPVAIFPETTTSDGTRLLRFQGRLMQAAIAEGVDLIPLALSLHRPDGSIAREALFIDDQSFMRSVLSLCAARQVTLTVQVLEPIPSAGALRDALALESRRRIAQALGHPEDAGGRLPARRQARTAG